MTVYVERLLQINVATLAALGTLLLGMGQRSAWLPLFSMIAAGTSVWLTDVTGWFRLNRKVANVAALAAKSPRPRRCPTSASTLSGYACKGRPGSSASSTALIVSAIVGATPSLKGTSASELRARCPSR